MKNSKIKIGDFCVFWNNKWSSPIIGFLDEQVIQNESSTCIAKCLWKTCDFVFEYCVKYSELPNVLRLCVCLPLAQSFNLPQMLMGQIAQNRCYV